MLDLRDNGGGLLNEAVNVASIFIPDGTIVSTDGRSQPRQVYTATGGAIPGSIPVVVLVDQGTASASEIVTGALQDRHRAKVVGTHTYGKGVFQEIEPALQRRRARHHGRRVLHAQRAATSAAEACVRAPGSRPTSTRSTIRTTQADEALNVALRVVDGQIR